MSIIFSDTFIGSGPVRGTQPQVGFRPDGLPYQGAAAFGENANRRQARSPEGSRSGNVFDNSDTYGQFGFLIEYPDASGQAVRRDDPVAAYDSQAWVPGSTEWEVTFDVRTDYDPTGESFTGAFLEFGNTFNGTVRVQIGGSERKWFFTAEHPQLGSGFGRAEMPDVKQLGFHRMKLIHTRKGMKFEGGGGTFDVAFPEITDERNFDVVKVHTQPGYMGIRNLVVSRLAAPATFWSRFRHSVEA